MSTPPPDLRFRAIQKQAEEYESTVHALLSFSAFVVHTGREQREGSHFGFGRRMDTSPQNPVAPETVVTPDLVAQKDASFGVVAEVKRSLSADQTTWADHLRQLRKYDDDLAGWWTDTEHVEKTDTLILVHQSRSRAFVRFLQAQVNEDPDCVGGSTAVVEFNLSNEVNPFIFFRVEWSRVSDDELQARLDLGEEVPLNRVLQSFPSVKFYDAAPPTPWLMMLLWTDFFAASVDPSAYSESLKATPIDVSVEEITAELQRAYGSSALERDQRSAQFPRAKWVRRALDGLVTAKLALRGEEAGKYRILYKPVPGDVLQRFVHLTERPEEEQAPDQAQIPLPLAEDDDDDSEAV